MMQRLCHTPILLQSTQSLQYPMLEQHHVNLFGPHYKFNFKKTWQQFLLCVKHFELHLLYEGCNMHLNYCLFNTPVQGEDAAQIYQLVICVCTVCGCTCGCLPVCVSVCLRLMKQADKERGGQGGQLSSVQPLDLFPGGELPDKTLDPKDQRQQDLSHHYRYCRLSVGRR